MPYYWSTWLPEALAKDPFVGSRMVLDAGWSTRGRPSSVYMPSGIVCHHTACMLGVGHNPQTCINTIKAGNSVAPGPISQLLLTHTPPGIKWNGSNPDPRIIVIAAGRSNHAGAGEYPWGAPEGNGSSIGIEACGPGEHGWSDIAIELYQKVVAAILKHNGWPIQNVTTHWEYARPIGRKIDPSGPWKGQRNLARLDHWHPQVWRDSISPLLAPPPQPQPEPTPPPTEYQGSIGQNFMYPVDYGVAGVDWWWTEMAITVKGLQWSGGPTPESQKIRQTFVSLPTLPRAPRLQNDQDVINLMKAIGTFGPCPSTFATNAGLSSAWQTYLNPGR